MKKTLLSLILSATLGATAHAADLTIAYSADPVSMDPMEQLSQETMQMAYTLFEPLVYSDQHLKTQPRLAERWEQIDPKTMRFYLRKGVKFHSGNTMTADDVIFSFNREKQSVDFKALFEPYTEMKKVDDYTVDLVMKEPYPLVLQNMTYLVVMDSQFYSGKDENGQDKGLVEKSSNTYASHHVSGTGPFKLQSFRPGQRSEYVRFDDYWNKANTGNVDKITLVVIKENATRLSALLSNDVDWIYPVPPTDLDRVRDDKNHKLYSIPSDRLIAIQMNANVVPAFKDVRVRQAVVAAVNNEGIVEKIMRGNATAGAQFSPDGFSGHNPDLKPHYDLKKAKELMKEAGYEKGFNVTFISPNDRYVNDEKIAQTVSAMLSRINIKVDLNAMPRAQYWNEFDKCAAGLQLIGWSSDTMDSANFSEFLTMTRDEKTGYGQYNCNGYSNPKLDKLVQDANFETDTNKRNEMLREVSKIEYDDAVVIPLHWENLNWGMSNKIENFDEVVNLKNFPLWDQLKIKE
ncbi:ABC transporter substrate-binding protein [Basilea psittacipulmonis]|uniref:Cytochrome C n=1 Tax=Basilea psittacipulmonis DSM 24701 TaxID=1072685 RepID=A0A077DFD4_9BURK|nr:ABC transporter substrate-binding protein [Basilea psittacipulmonis]AIL32851.1 cytochrome C [Basilea psittacipulmonis DSM 24701]